MRERFSCITRVTKRQAFIFMLTAMYNLSNMGLYIESPNEFPEHYGYIDHRLSEFSKDNEAQIVLFATIVFFTLILGYSNQKSYYYHIDKTLPQPQNDRDLEAYPLIQTSESAVEPGMLELVLSGVSSAYKASVASSSLAALLKNTAGPAWAISASILCGPGNFAAQFAVFAAPFVKKYHWHVGRKKRYFLSHFLTLLYNIPNVALYFNVGDAFLQHIGALDHRLSELEGGLEYFPFLFLAAGSAFLFLSTQRSYSKKIAEVFTDPEKETAAEDTQSEGSYWTCLEDKLSRFFVLESCSTAVYKAVINYIALVSAFYSFSNQLTVSFVLASLCIPGNLYAQYSILKPEQSRQQRLNEQLEPTESRSCCWGLFTQRVQAEPQGLSLKNKTILSV